MASNGDLPATPPGVFMTTLDNGLTIIVREDHSAPVVSAQAWCMAGSINEDNWLGAGLSHVLEHMLFKGTTTRPGSRIDQEVQEAGGYMNAYTSFDRTVYHIDVPNTGAKVAIDILCDIMQNASLPPDELAKEMDVILREMDMTTDDPGRRSSRRLFETAYTKSPYRFAIIGYPDIFKELKPPDILAYYRAKYVPNNVFFVVTGDVKASEAAAQIQSAYAAAKARPMPPTVLPLEPRQTAGREVIEEAPVELAHFHLSWHIPDLRHPDVPVLDVLAAVVGNGRSSRLYQNAREKKGLVHSIEAWTYSPGNPGLIGVSATADADKFAAARALILEEIEKLKAGEVPADELAKAVKQFVAGTLASRKTMQGQAHDLGGSWLAANDLNFSERYLAAVKRVSAADLRRVAKEYLTSENRTLYALLPAGTAPSSAGISEITREHPISKIDLPCGLRLLVKENHRLPFVEFRALFKGGVLVETPENNGVTQLTAKLLLKGTQRRSAEEISREIESVGGSIDSFGGNNTFGINAEVLSDDFDLGLDLVADVLLNPTFPVAELERERQVQLAGIRAQRDHLLQSTFKAARRALFGEVGYGLDPLGTESSVQGIRPADLALYHRTHATPDNCVLAVFGDVNSEVVHAAVEKAFGGWIRSNASPSPRATHHSSRRSARVTETRDKKQAVLVLGYPGVTLRDPDRYPLELLQEACSDLGSRLFLRIRDELGLAYYVGAQHFAGLSPGYFVFYVGTMPEKAAEVESELLSQAALLCSGGITEAELKRAKAKVIGQRKIARQDLGALATATALDELYDLGYKYSDKEDALYEAVTGDQIKAAAQKYLKPESAVLAISGPDSK